MKVGLKATEAGRCGERLGDIFLSLVEGMLKTTYLSDYAKVGS